MSFIFGGNTGESQADITDARKRLALAMLQQGTDSSPIQSPWQGVARLGEALMGGLAARRQAQQQQTADAQLMSAITGQPYTPPAQSPGFLSSLFGGSKVPASGAQGEVAATNPGVSGHASDISGLDSNQIYSGFMDTVKGGVTNPYALAAIASTGKAESGFSPGNAAGTWNDGANNAGGIMSWNGPRLAALQKFAGGGNGTPQQQGQFFLQENPALITALNNAKSVDEAQHLMNNAWAFKGYNVPGNANAANRLATAQALLPQFAQSGAPMPVAPPQTQVASLDPSAGMSAMPQSRPAAPPPSPTMQPDNMANVTPDQMRAILGPQPTPGYVDPMVTTAYRQSPPQMPATQAIQQQAPLPDQQQTASIDPNSTGVPVPTGEISQLPAQAASSAAAPAIRLAQAMQNAPAPQNASPLANNPRAQALVGAMMNPNASPQVRSLAGVMLQQVMRPNDYGFQTLPDGTIMRTDPRTGTVAPVYQATPKPVEVNGRLVDPVTGRVIADYSNPQVSTVDGAVVDNRTGQPIYQSHKPMDVNGHLVDPVSGQQVGDYSNPNVSEVDGALVDQRTGKVLYQGTPKGVTVDPGQSLVNPQTGQVLVQGSGYKPSDVTDLRKEIQQLPSYKSYQQASPVYQSMIDTAKTDSKASDLNLVYGLGKIMDPNSVVREGEMVMVNNTSSLPDWLMGAINSVNGGSKLEPGTRKAILTEAKSRMNSYQGMLDNDLNQYRGIVSRRGMNQADVLPVLNSIADVPDLTGNAASAPVKVNSVDDYQKLPSGAQYIDPNGNTRTKP
ncbi:hypothetical protein [Rhizobium sp. NXC24]|uniref:hypothetical protein n=1 Tax=Rhizobium sp. NXC24 TaxID=2048897 RepID=UPI000CDF3645|nr:hypothetical protein [Rhizobium sp. NXC24]AVA22464.1 hypothetical protein NXC24_CH02834 [Rhizobium sp. NXC24]